MSTIPEKVHRKELAEFLELTPRRIDQLSEDGHIPKQEDGLIPFAPAIRGIIASKKERSTPAMERLNAAKASREERKDRQESGEDISAPMAIRATEGIHLITRQRIMRVGNNVQSKIGLTEIQKKAIEDECRSALGELSKKVVYAKLLAETESDESALKYIEAQNESHDSKD